MARRPITEKQRRKVAKAFRQKLPARFDLVQWLIDHGHARTRREAGEVILAKRVKANSHVLGVRQELAPRATTLAQVLAGGMEHELIVKDAVDPFVPVEARPDVIVEAKPDVLIDGEPFVSESAAA